ncbi:MAG: NUDIX hydrolase [Rickettsiaceae bacterium]
MQKSNMRPQIGIGVLVFNDLNQLLLGHRTSSHGEGEFGLPGGHLEFGESFEDCAVREVKEEAGFDIKEPKFLSLTNDIFIESSKHYVSIFMCASFDENQKIVNMEPEKVIGWKWYDLSNLPMPLFLPLNTLVSQGGLDDFK